MSNTHRSIERVVKDLAGCSIDEYEVQIYDELLPLTKFEPFAKPSPEFEEIRKRRMAPFADKLQEGMVRCQESAGREPEIAPQERVPLNHEIRARARELGCELCGFTTIEPSWIFSGCQDKVLYENVVVLGMEMDYEAIDQAPHEAAGLETMRAYADLGLSAAGVADFILQKGYHAQAHHPMGGNVLYLPHAIKAGLGQLGTNGNLCTQEFGPRLRLTTVTTDAPLTYDEPRDLKINKLCAACQICIDRCPGRALSPFKVHWRGATKWKNNWTRCYPIFQKWGSCLLCIKFCPLHKYGYSATMETFLGTSTPWGR